MINFGWFYTQFTENPSQFIEVCFKYQRNISVTSGIASQDLT